MNLFVAWRDSLSIFQPKNLKLFMLVTLKAMVDTFKVWIKYFWWLPVLFIVKTYLQYSMMQAAYTGTLTGFLGTLWSLLASIPAPIYIILPSLMYVARASLLLAARPSTAIKNCAYFRSYFFRALLVIALFQLMAIAGMVAGSYLIMRYPACASYSLLCGYSIGAIGFLFSYYVINYALFYLDSDGSMGIFLRSSVYAAKMTLYNLPFYGILTILNTIVGMSITSVFLYVAKFFGGQSVMLFIAPILMLIFALLELFSVCFLTNFYVKKLHDQFTLYYGKNA